MAAGLGFKDFATGEVLTAADVDGYLMQGVWVFASATARDAAVTSPQEGNFAYLKDTNVTTYYTGSAWANLDTTGMTNPMTTTGDTIYSSSGSTPARLGIGTAGQVLQVNSGATAPEWATPAGGGSGLTLINTTSFSGVGSQSVNDVFSTTYLNYKIIVTLDTDANINDALFRLRVSGSDNTSANYTWVRGNTNQAGNFYGTSSGGSNGTSFNIAHISGGRSSSFIMELNSPFATDDTNFHCLQGAFEDLTNYLYGFSGGVTSVTTSYTGFTLFLGSGTMTGSLSVYGYAK